MTKHKLQPFFDEWGNLVIPPQLLEPQPAEKTLILEVQGKRLTVHVQGSSIISISDLGGSTPANGMLYIDDADLLDAAASSMGFWDNPVDDAVWNNA